MDTAIALFGALSFGSLITLIIERWLNRNHERRATRRAFYLDLLAMLMNRKRHLYRLSWDHDGESPEDIDPAKFDDWNARLLVDASPEVRKLASACDRTLLKFWNTLDMRAPIVEDEHGFFHYQVEEMARLDEEGRAMKMRMALGDLHTTFDKQVTALGDRIRVELYGKS